jgi:hypothetical protein
MVKLRQDSTGKYLARKRLPDDVRDEYGRRHKAHYEAKFSAPASDGPHIAKQKFREWDAEVTARIEAIRAERKGEGISLTRQQARALAGEWYHWFIARHPTTNLSNGTQFASKCMRRCARRWAMPSGNEAILTNFGSTTQS